MLIAEVMSLCKRVEPLPKISAVARYALGPVDWVRRKYHSVNGKNYRCQVSAYVDSLHPQVDLASVRQSSLFH